MDLKVQTNYGLTEDNIELLSDVPGIDEVQPGYSADVFSGDNALILKVHSYNSDKPLNQYSMIEGRLPEDSEKSYWMTSWLESMRWATK